MTVQNTNRKDVYLTNGTTIYWPYTFEIFTTDGSDLALYETNLTTGETVLIDTNLTRDIINSRIKYPRTGSPRPEGYKITVARVTERTQGIDLETQSFDPKNMERGLDKLTAMVQEIDETVSRAAVTDISQQGVNFTLPPPVGGKVIGWNAEGTRLINLDNTTLGIEAQMLAATEAAQTAAEAAQTAAEAAQTAAEAAQTAVETLETAEPLGVVKEYYGSTLPPRHLWVDGKTIGDAISGATARADADVFNLYAVLWGSVDNTNSQIKIYDSSGVLTEKGASAADDFAAHKAISLPDKRGRVGIGLDNMGGTSANVVVSNQADVVGGTGGAETHALNVNEMPEHVHNAGVQTRFGFGTTHNFWHYSANGDTNGRDSTGFTGGSQPHNNMQPWVACNYIMRY